MQVVFLAIGLFLAVTVTILRGLIASEPPRAIDEAISRTGTGSTVVASQNPSATPFIQATATISALPVRTPGVDPSESMPGAPPGVASTPETVAAATLLDAEAAIDTADLATTEDTGGPEDVQTDDSGIDASESAELQDEIDASSGVADVEAVEAEIGEVGEEVAQVDEAYSAWEYAIRTLDGGVMGVVSGGMANIRSAPSLDAPVVGELLAGFPITVYGEVYGDYAGDSDLWLDIGGGAYVSAALIEPFIPPAPLASHAGAWVDINLSQHYAIAYQGDVPVYAAIVITGMPGFETPVGEYTIIQRVESDTLDSATVGIPPDDPNYYYLTDVKHVQYFADDGFALHANYWSGAWEYGSARSHGCVNLMERDAAWFWSFLGTGSAVSIHY